VRRRGHPRRVVWASTGSWRSAPLHCRGLRAIAKSAVELMSWGRGISFVALITAGAARTPDVQPADGTNTTAKCRSGRFKQLFGTKSQDIRKVCCQGRMTARGLTTFLRA
jgi:hypothetical protein